MGQLSAMFLDIRYKRFLLKCRINQTLSLLHLSRTQRFIDVELFNGLFICKFIDFDEANKDEYYRLLQERFFPL